MKINDILTALDDITRNPDSLDDTAKNQLLHKMQNCREALEWNIEQPLTLQEI